MNFQNLKGQLRHNFVLAPTTWFQVGGSADYFYKPHDIKDLANFVTQLNNNKIDYLALGVGSNLLIRDGGFRGAIIKLGRKFNYIVEHTNSIEVGASTLDRNLAEWAAEHKIAKLEFLAGIPGTIGGAIMMNAGCYNSEIKDVLLKFEVITPNGEIKIVNKEESEFSYRSSNLDSRTIITRAWFIKAPGDYKLIKQKIDIITQKRTESQPVRSKTGGSTFRNPDNSNHKAWELIDKVGLRGYSIGEAQISVKHCNFLINKNNAKAAELEQLGNLAKKKVKEKFDIDLKWEIKIIGEVNV
jgi:UDP-N-acetylmuramate dehydrogenase